MRGAVFLLAVSMAAAQEPVFRADTHVVEVAVVAKDARDVPVTDLRQQDLRLFDNGVEQTILSFDKLGGGVAGVVSKRLSVIVLDGLNTSWSDQIYGRDAVAQVLAKLSPEKDRVAIFTLGDQLALLHDVSSDFVALKAAVDNYAGERPFFGVEDDRPSNPLAAKYSSEEIMHGSTPQADLFAGFAGEARRDNAIDALRTIAEILKHARGEKSLLWITGGFPPPMAHRGMQRAAEELAAAKVMLYPVDARGLLMNIKARDNVDSMMELAEMTGGRAYYNDNGIADLVQAAMDDSREGYVLTYAPSSYKADGAEHVVQLKTVRQGVELRYRPAYESDRGQ